MLFPPIAVMPFMVVPAPGLRVIIVIVFGSVPAIRVVNSCVTIPGIVIGVFRMPGIINRRSAARIVNG